MSEMEAAAVQRMRHAEGEVDRLMALRPRLEVIREALNLAGWRIVEAGHINACHHGDHEGYPCECRYDKDRAELDAAIDALDECIAAMRCWRCKGTGIVRAGSEFGAGACGECGGSGEWVGDEQKATSDF